MKVAHFTYHERPWSLNAERSGKGHGHWSTTRKVTEQWRTAFWALGVQQRAKFHKVHVIVNVVMKPPLADTGNAYGAIKAAIDGLVDARVIPNDDASTVQSLTMIAPRKPYVTEREHVTLTLVEGDTNNNQCVFCVAREQGEMT